MEEGKIMFEKVLTASSLPPFRQLILPDRFVSQHGDKVHQFITLRNAEIGKTWSLKININFPHKRPQAQFCEGWRAFAVANHLAIGDRLTFVLVAKASFDVFIFPRPLSVKKWKLRSRNPLPARGEAIPSHPGPRFGCNFSPNGSEESEVTSNDPSFASPSFAKDTSFAFAPSFAKETEEETATEAPDQSPSDTDSGFVDPMIQAKEEACIICQVASMTESGMIKVNANFHGPQTPKIFK